MSVQTYDLGNKFSDSSFRDSNIDIVPKEKGRYVSRSDYDRVLASHKRLVKESGELFKSHCLNQHSVSKLCPICVDFAEALRLARELEGA